MPQLYNIVESVVLHCNRGTADKIYEIYLKEGPYGNWRVTANYGRRGSVLRPVNKYDGSSELSARMIYRNLKHEKENDYYEDITERRRAAVHPPMPRHQREVVADPAPEPKPKAKPKANPAPTPERDITIGDL
jgi:hypothetical protein